MAELSLKETAQHDIGLENVTLDPKFQSVSTGMGHLRNQISYSRIKTDIVQKVKNAYAFGRFSDFSKS